MSETPNFGRAGWLRRVWPVLWPAFKLLYRVAGVVTAALFGAVWLRCLGQAPGFQSAAAHFAGDAETLYGMAGWALGFAGYVVWALLWRLPLIVAVPAALLVVSFPITALIRSARADRGRA
jgi:hypothetical protein